MRPLLSRRDSLCLLAAAASSLALPSAAQTLPTRPEAWAVPLSLPGVPDLHRVTPALYRCAQPDATGFANLAKLGVQSVINLRRSVDDAPLAAGTGLTLVHIKIKTRHIRENQSAQIIAALRALVAAKPPVVVHCTHGADRTGLIIALWRMLYQGWSREDATAELVNGGFGFHAVWQNIPHYLATVDLVWLRAKVEA